MPFEDQIIDVDRIVRNIREQVRDRLGDIRGDSPPVDTEKRSSEHLRAVIAGLEASVRNVEAQAGLIGRLTPIPPTLRGRLGALAARFIGRVLWWYTFQLRELSDRALHFYREQIRALETIGCNGLIELRHDTDRLHSMVQVLSDGQARAKSSAAKLDSNIERALRDVRSRTDSLAAKLDSSINAQRENVERALRDVQSQAESLAAKLDFSINAQRENTEEGLREMGSRLESLVARLDATVGSFHGQQGDSAALRLQMEGLAARIDSLSNAQALSAGRLSELGVFTHQTRAQCSLQDSRLSLLFKEMRQHVPLAQRQVEATANGERSKYDLLYAAFEDVYRGTPEEIKAKQRIYIPILRAHGVGLSHTPVLDIGCGRGEWLQVLRESELVGRGIDRNEEMIRRCRSQGLEVVQTDALAYLRELPDGSVGAITAFHVVEHLPFDLVLELLDECLRVIRVAGLVVLETPNPQNLQVGAHTFYLDPTHLRPLPSGMLRFFVEARGFCDVHIRDLHPYPPAVLLPQDHDVCAARFNDLMYGAQDYAVIGRKA
jgi:O-antigen chain-terminating methyltransferase